MRKEGLKKGTKEGRKKERKGGRKRGKIFSYLDTNFAMRVTKSQSAVRLVEGQFPVRQKIWGQSKA
jgi:hypothetical protein